MIDLIDKKAVISSKGNSMTGFARLCRFESILEKGGKARAECFCVWSNALGPITDVVAGGRAEVSGSVPKLD